MSEQQRPPSTPAETPPEDGQEIIRIPREVLEAAHTPEGQALYEYGIEYEQELIEKGLIHP